MKSIYLLIGLFIMTTSSCKSSKSTMSQVDLDAFYTMVSNKQFRIESNWAQPQVTTAMLQVLSSGILQPGSSAGSINLTGNYNFLRISGDSITSYLPYFGERQMNVAYGGGDNAIEFNGLIKNYRAEQNKDNSYDINLEAKSNTENFKVFIKLFSNLNSTMTLQGMSRFSIQYTGAVAPFNNQ